MFLLKRRSALIWKSDKTTREAVYAETLCKTPTDVPLLSLYVWYNNILHQQSEVSEH